MTSQIQSKKKYTEVKIIVEMQILHQENIQLNRNFTSAQILPTVEIVSTGYKPRRVSAPRRMASLPEVKAIVHHDRTVLSKCTMDQYVRLQRPESTKDFWKSTKNCQELTVENCICHISCLRTSRPEVVSHAVHDTSNNSRLSSHVALVKCGLLKQKDLQYGEPREVRSKAKRTSIKKTIVAS